MLRLLRKLTKSPVVGEETPTTKVVILASIWWIISSKVNGKEERAVKAEKVEEVRVEKMEAVPLLVSYCTSALCSPSLRPVATPCVEIPSKSQL